jgi:hypothetical protein
VRDELGPLFRASLRQHGTLAARGDDEVRGAELVVSLPLLAERAAGPDLTPGAPDAGAAPRPRA